MKQYTPWHSLTANNHTNCTLSHSFTQWIITHSLIHSVNDQLSHSNLQNEQFRLTNSATTKDKPESWIHVLWGWPNRHNIKINCNYDRLNINVKSQWQHGKYEIWINYNIIINYNFRTLSVWSTQDTNHLRNVGITASSASENVRSQLVMSSGRGSSSGIWISNSNSNSVNNTEYLSSNNNQQA